MPVSDVAGGRTRVGGVELAQEVRERLDQLTGEQHEQPLQSVRDAVSHPAEGQHPFPRYSFSLTPIKELHESEREGERERSSA